MLSNTIRVVLFGAVLCCAACGDSSFTPSDGAIPTPVKGPTGTPPDISLPDSGPIPDLAPASDSFATQGCCDVLFAVAETSDYAYVRLRGGEFPFSDGDGIELTYNAGVWSATVCVPPTYNSFYYYEFGLDAADAGVIADPRPNPFGVVIANTEYGDVNGFPSAADCATLDTAIHSKTSN